MAHPLKYDFTFSLSHGMIRLVGRWEVHKHVAVWYLVEILCLLTSKLIDEPKLQREFPDGMLVWVCLAHGQDKLIDAE